MATPELPSSPKRLEPTIELPGAKDFENQFPIEPLPPPPSAVHPPSPEVPSSETAAPANGDVSLTALEKPTLSPEKPAEVVPQTAEGIFAKYLDYEDVRGPAERPPALKGNERAYAETLGKLLQQYGPEKIEKQAKLVQKRAVEILEKLNIPNPQQETQSLSWVYWDMAKQEYLNETFGKKNNGYNEGYKLGNPLTDLPILQSVLDRHVGWEIYQRVQDRKRQQVENGKRTDLDFYKDIGTEMNVAGQLAYPGIEKLLRTEPKKENGDLSSKDLASLGTNLRRGLEQREKSPDKYALKPEDLIVLQKELEAPPKDASEKEHKSYWRKLFTRAEKEGVLQKEPSLEKKDQTAGSEGLRKGTEHLSKRNAELKERASKWEKADTFFSSLGERYNKMPLKYKLAIGLGLGAGAAVFAGVSVPLTALFATGLGAQRFLGGVGMYSKMRNFALDSERISQDKTRWGLTRAIARRFKNFSESDRKAYAAVAAVWYTIGFGSAVGAAVNIAAESGWAQTARSWVQTLLPSGQGSLTSPSTTLESAEPPISSPQNETLPPASGSSEPPPAYKGPLPPLEVSPPPPSGAEAAPPSSFGPTPEPIQPNVSGASPEVAMPMDEPPFTETAPAAGTQAEIPFQPHEVYASVEATKGKGYEFMAKRIWEQLQGKYASVDELLAAKPHLKDSDLHKLLLAGPKSIDGVVHRIAMDPGHGFFRPDGTSILIKPGSVMSLDENGMLRMNDAVKAPAAAPVTSSVSGPSAAELEARAKSALDAQELNIRSAQNPESFTPPQQVKPIPEPRPAIEASPTVPPQPSPVEPPPATRPPTRLEPLTPNVLEPTGPGQSVEVPGSSEQPPALPVEYPTTFRNAKNLFIDPLHGNIFEDARGTVMAFGNDFGARLAAAKEYVSAHRGATVYLQAEKPILINGQWMPAVVEVKSGRFFGGPQVIEPKAGELAKVGKINPDTFTRQVTFTS